MPGQVTRPSERPLRGLTPPARLGLPFLTLFFILSPSPYAFAHRLEAEAVLRPFGEVQVETWFETGDSPKAARVRVLTADGRLVTEGRCDARGIFVFHYVESEPLRVVVDAGAGHRAEVQISAAMLATNALCTAAACVSPPPSMLTAPLLVKIQPARPPAPLPVVERHTGPPLGRLALGVGMLLAVAIFVQLRLRRSVQARS